MTCPGSAPRREQGAFRRLSMRVLDADGNELDGSLLRVTNAGVTLRTVTVEQNRYTTKTLTVSDLVRLEGEPAAGYEVKSVTITPLPCWPRETAPRWIRWTPCSPLGHRP